MVKMVAYSPTIEEAEIECRKHYSEFILREIIRYLIIDKTTKEIVGRCAFPPQYANWSIPQFSIAYFIRKSQRSKAYATEATSALACLAFKILKAKKVEIYCDAENIASLKVPQKLGFQLEYTQKGGWLRHNGELAELQTYSLFSIDKLPQTGISW